MLAATILAATASATGIPADSGRQLDACIGAAGTVDLQVKDCYVALAQREDTRLNANWKELIKAVGGAGTQKGTALVSEQKAWIAFRDASCLHLMIDGGTLDRVQSQACYADLITKRANEIADFARIYEQTYSSN